MEFAKANKNTKTKQIFQGFFPVYLLIKTLQSVKIIFFKKTIISADVKRVVSGVYF